MMCDIIHGSESQVVIHWASETLSGHADLLKDSNGNPLNAGGAGNGDGCLVTLGYFEDGTTSDPFAGTWKPLTHGTRIGDSSSGYGYEDGMFLFTTVFTKSSDSVIVYPYRPASFTLNTQEILTDDLPEPGTPLCIRFYDGTDAGLTARYNTVTGSGWLWPGFPYGDGIPQNYYFKVARGSAPSGSDWEYGSIFEDSDHEFSAAKISEFNLSVNISGSGSVTPVSGSYEYGTVVELNATADDHMDFIGWLGDGVDDPTLEITSITLNQDRNITAVFQDTIYSVIVNPLGHGSVSLSGDGNYTFGTIVNLNATPDPGYLFSHWNGFGPDSNISASTTLSVSQDHAIVGVFTPQSFDLNVSSADSSHGLVEVVQSGPYIYDGNYTIHASPNPGYAFSHWTSSSNSLGMLESNSSQTTNLILSNDAVFEGHFSLTTYQLEVLMGPGGQSVSPGTGQQSSIALVPVTAQPIDGYEFTKWEDPYGILINPNSPNTDANMSRASGDVSITAKFSTQTHDIIIIEGEGGNAQVSPSQGPWDHFGVYDVNATPHPGYFFTGWTGTAESTDCLVDSNFSNPDNQIWLLNPVTLTANFSQSTYLIDTGESEGGVVSGAGNYTINDTPILEANESIGWDFSEWTGSNLEFLSDPNSSITLVSLSQAPTYLQFDAIFVREAYDHNISVEGNGSVTFNGSNLLNQTLDSNSTVQLLAEPTTGWAFTQWFGSPVSGNTDPYISFIPLESSEIRAIFNRNKYDLTVNQTENGDANGSGTYDFEDQVSISATPITGYLFDEWTGDTSYLSEPTSPQTIVTIPAGNVSITPQFRRNQYTLTVNPTENGDANGSGTYSFEDQVPISATPIPGYLFDEWTGDSSYLSEPTSPQTIVTIPSSNISITPTFRPIPFYISATTSDPGTISGTGDYAPGSTVSLLGTGNTADTNAPRGYKLHKWSWTKGNGSTGQSSQNPLSFTADDNYTVIAYFSAIPPNEVTFSLLSDPTGSGFLHDDQDKRIWDLPTDLYQRTISASPKTGYSFIGWSSTPTLNYSPSWKSSIIETLPSENSILTANFLPTVHKVEIEHDPSQGTVSGAGTNFASNQQTTLTAQPNENYEFSGWTIDKTVSYSITRQTSSINSSSNKLFVDNRESPALSLIRGFTYEFTCDLDDTDLFYISSQAEPSQVFDGEYLEGISNSRTSSNTLSFTVPENAPDVLYYQSSTSIDEINLIHVISLNDTDILPYPENLSVQPLLNFDLKLNASFSPKEFQLSFATNEGGKIETPVSGNYAYGQVLQLIAVPDSYYEFVRWEGSDLIADPTSSNTTLLMDKERLINAVFQDITYQINLSVSPSDSGVARIVEGNTGHKYGNTVSLEATPKDDYVFDSWTGGTVSNSTSPKANATVTGNLSFQANFKEKLFSVALSSETKDFLGKTLDQPSLGQVSGPSLVKPNHANTYTALPVEGYSFLHWESADGENLSTSEIASLSFTENSSIKAIFQQNSYEIEIEVTPSGSGYVEYQNQEITGNATLTMGHGYSFDLNAYSIGNFAFEKWSSNFDLETDGTNSLLSVSPQDGLRIVAHFKPTPSPYLETYASPPSGGIVFGEGYRENTFHSIFAVPYEGFRFSRWVGSGVDDPNSYNTYMYFDTNTTITAIFEEETSESDPNYPVIDQNGTSTLTLLTSNSEHGGVAGSGTFGYGWADISAVAKTGFKFVRWEGNYVSNPLLENTQVFLAEDSVVLMAVFQESQSEQEYATVTKKVKTRDYSGNISVGQNGGSIIGGSSFSFGSTPTFYALANSGYKLVGWTDSTGEIIESSSKYSFTINYDVTVEAIFEAISYEVIFASVTSEKGSIEWEGKGESSYFADTLASGEKINLQALPRQGYEFVRWTGVNYQPENPTNPLLTINDLNQKIELNATFSQNAPIYLNIVISPENGGWAIGNGAYDYDSSHSIFAKTNPGYLFSHWSGTGILDQLNANTSILLDQNKTITAHFFIDPESPPTDINESKPIGLYNLDVTSANPEQGIAAGSGVYSSGWVGVYAQAKEGYLFDQWTGGEFSDSFITNSQYRLTTDSVITAVFKVSPIVPESMDLSSGWFSSEWFGTYWMLPNQNWVFHLELGWIYLHFTDNENFWFWSDQLSSWLWSGKSKMPYFYLYNSATWIYFEFQSSPLRYYLFEEYNNNNKAGWYEY